MADEFKKKFDEMMAQQKKINAGAKKLEESLAQQLKMQGDIIKIKEDILNTQNEILKFEEENKKALKDEAKLLAEIEKLKEKGLKSTDKEITQLEKKLKKVQKIKLASGENLKIAKEQKEEQEEGLDTMRKMVEESNKLKSAARSSINFVKKWGFDKLKAYGVFEMDKEIRNAARSMGVGGKEFQKFADNMGNAGLATNRIGVSTKQLAKLQQGYSQEVGRSVRLTEDGLIAMGEMVEGTGLGEQYAIGMAGAMDKFGGSVETTRDLVQETMNIADAMGVNSAKAAESLSKNLKFAQKYKFKDGVKGLAKMSTEALKLRLDLDGIAGLADKVFRPEGAIEMAAQLQTMGGSFAQMANPMQLMFKARNDFAGFAKDIGKATAEFVEYNKETGTFDIKGGLAADRMREIGRMTGLGVEKLQEMAAAQQRINMIGSMTPFNLSDEDKEMVESLATIGTDGQIQINVGDGVRNIKDLQRGDLDRIRAEKKSLEERAKQSRTFAEVLEDLRNSFRTLLLPIAQGLKEGLAVPLQDIMEDFNKNGGFYDTAKEWGRDIADLIKGLKPFVEGVGKFISAIGPGGTLATILGLKAAPWIWRGVKLGLGFNQTASVSGGGGGTLGTTRGLMGRTARNTMRGRGLSGRMGKLGRSMAKGGFGKGGALALGGMAANVGREFMDDPDSDAGKLLGIAGNTASWAGTGAMLGSVIPGIGTAAGAIIGGLGGLSYGLYDEYFSDKATNVQDGIIKFHPNDKFMTMNDGMIMASTQEGKLDKAAKELSSTGEVNHKFDDVKIKIEINANGIDNEIGKKIIDNKEFIRSINTKIREEASMVLSGGVLSPTPK